MEEKIINQFQTWVKEQGKSQNTITTYSGVLRKFYQWLIEEKKKTILSEVTREDVQDYMNYLDNVQQKSASTIDKVFAAIRVFSQFINNPTIVKEIERKEKQKNIYQTNPMCLSEEELKDILKTVKQSKNLRNIAIVYTLLHTGIRLSELCGLDFSDMKLKGKQGTLNINGEKQRVIPLTEELIIHLKQYINSLDIMEGPLFISSSRQRLTRRAVQYILEEYNINSKTLRHTFCQNLINCSYLSVVAQQVGHSDINMLRRYKKKEQ